MEVFFFCPEELEYRDQSLEELTMAPGRIVWSVLTSRYLKLYHPELSVKVGDDVPDKGVIVFHASYRKQLLCRIKTFKGIKLVCTASDSNLDRTYADYHFYQNPSQSHSQRDFYLVHWPQCSLVPRDSKRAARVENIEFKGAKQNLAAELCSTEFRKKLRKLDAHLIISSPDYTSSFDNGIWSDFSQTDLQLALRPWKERGWNNKPASKLINGWLAGVPSLLGPESAYRYYKKNDLDYIEVSCQREVVEAIQYLKNNPSFYLDMVENARERGKEFSFEVISHQWIKAFERVEGDRLPVISSIINSFPKAVAYKLKKSKFG